VCALIYYCTVQPTKNYLLHPVRIRSSKLYSDESWPVNLDASKRAFGFPFIMAVMFLLFRITWMLCVQFSDINDPDFRVKPGYKESHSSDV